MHNWQIADVGGPIGVEIGVLLLGVEALLVLVDRLLLKLERCCLGCRCKWPRWGAAGAGGKVVVGVGELLLELGSTCTLWELGSTCTL